MSLSGRRPWRAGGCLSRKQPDRLLSNLKNSSIAKKGSMDGEEKVPLLFFPATGCNPHIYLDINTEIGVIVQKTDQYIQQ
jgi:hypothetical protein